MLTEGSQRCHPTHTPEWRAVRALVDGHDAHHGRRRPTARQHATDAVPQDSTLLVYGGVQ